MVTPLAKVIVLPPAAADFVPEHVPPTLGEEATTRLSGKVSTRAALNV